MKDAVNDYSFTRYVRALTDFANEDLSAFFFDIRKDCLYCDVGESLPTGSVKRQAYRTVLDTLFHALVRYASPVLCFTSEEVWHTRYPDAGSIHLEEWPEIDAAWRDEALGEKWTKIRAARDQVTEAIEPLRRDKVIRSSLEAEVTLPKLDEMDADDFTEICIVAGTRYEGDAVKVTKTDHHKCGRCWRLLPDVEEEGGLCGRCAEAING